MALPYLLDDLYTGSGTAKPYGCWTDVVTKFSAASFYNYEQDNLPLFDLEERTYFLWEKFGYPTSSIPGMVLLVSGDASESDVVCNGNIFLDVSSAIEALPRYLNFPVVIEVASFGDLGSLKVTDIKMGPNGSLEIINRTTYDSKVELNSYGYDASGSTKLAAGSHVDYANMWERVISTKNTAYDGLINFFSLIEDYSPSSLLGYPIFSGTYGTVSDNVALKTLDSRIQNNYSAFFGNPAGLYNSLVSNYEFGRLTAAKLTLPTAINANSELDVTASPIDHTLAVPEVTEYDPSSYSIIDGYSFANELYRTNSVTTDPASRVIKGTYYGNNLKSIVVKSCTGPIYIRGFYCSGDGSTDDTGVIVENSTVFFDNLAVARYVRHGVNIKNSKVSFIGSLYVHRCYAKDSNGDRISKRWLTNSTLIKAPEDHSAGIHCVNSHIDFVDSTDRYEDYITEKGYGTAYYRQGIQNLKVISRNSTGLRLINSTITGGRNRQVDTIGGATAYDTADLLTIEGNANYGIELDNSKLGFAGRLEIVGNTRGLNSNNSILNLDEFCIQNNHLYGVNLDNSEFTYGAYSVSATSRHDFTSMNIAVDTSYPKRYSYKFAGNGQHIRSLNSKILIPEYTKDISAYLGRLHMSNAHASDSLSNLLPSVELVNSIAKFINLVSLRKGSDSDVAEGAHILAKNNSDVYLLGTTSSVCCFLAGYPEVPSYDSMKYYAALAAEDNSTIRFRGPVMVWDGAVGAYAKSNSNLIFEPHKLANGALDVDGFELNNSKSHTMIEIKSYKSCLVADGNSNIVMNDLGSFRRYWAASDTTDSTYLSDTIGNHEAVSAGYFQFLPNPNDDDAYSTGVAGTSLNSRPSVATLAGAAGSYYWGRDPFNVDAFHLSSVTQGGLCLKALNGSHVRVRNVHFPCGYWNASSVIYDYNAPDAYCSRLFIWNLSNNSTLHADHLSISGVYPPLAGYHGPMAVWLSATDAPAYAAPSSTPDTSTLSVLDYYGSGYNNIWNLPNDTSAAYGQNGFLNQGPFRLYVGVDSLANYLFAPAQAAGYVTQVFAQGYNTSGNLSSIPETSGLYGKIFRISEASGLETSGFYYSNEFVKTDPNSILLDESAANCFANAKNGAMGTSNRPQICTIYIAKSSLYGEGQSTIAGGQGDGFKSPNIFDLIQEC
jgi:hypothetical protein